MNGFFTEHPTDPRYVQICVDDANKRVLLTDGGKHGSASHWYTPEEALELGNNLLKAALRLGAP